MRREIWSNLLYGSGRKSNSNSSPSSSSSSTTSEKINVVVDGNSAVTDRIDNIESVNMNIESMVSTDVRVKTEMAVSTATTTALTATALIDGVRGVTHESTQNNSANVSQSSAVESSALESKHNGMMISTSASTSTREGGFAIDDVHRDRDASSNNTSTGQEANINININCISSSSSSSEKERERNSNPSPSLSHGSLQLSEDVDVAALSAKYELTGGFIKNAVLSALLSAISRCKHAQTPVLTQVNTALHYIESAILCAYVVT